MATKSKKQLELFCDGIMRDDFTIVDQEKKVWTIEDARNAWNAGRVANYNLAFQRLAFNDFDVAKTRQQYAEMDAARR